MLDYELSNEATGTSTETSMLLPFDAFQKKFVLRINDFLSTLLQLKIDKANDSLTETPLFSAMQYSMLKGGKRLRPLLVYATGMSLGTSPDQLDAAAASIELIHGYSLIHDDLPAMDNDTLRRGKPTCHIAFDEATAILTGDALQALAFEILSDPHFNPVNEKIRLDMILTLSKAAGAFGMVGGQALDMFNSQIKPDQLDQKETIQIPSDENISHSNDIYSADLNTLCQIHRMKTGALIETAVRFGALSAINNSAMDDSSVNTVNTVNTVNNEAYIAKLSYFAQTLGLLFQVQDDILDVEGNKEVLGKTIGKDANQNKLTFPGLLGLNEAHHFAQQLFDECASSLEELSLKDSYLYGLLEVFINRES